MTSRADKIIIAKAIKQVGVEHLKTKKCDELSDGQLQKVMIARALAQNTPAILMDEPTSHLDMYHKAQVLHLLKNITQETQKTIVFATHEINLALQLCDQIILIHDEKVIQQSPDELVENKALLNLFPKDLIVFDENSRSFRISTKKQT
jgi:iron complex transport system ATP-binding protein